MRLEIIDENGSKRVEQIDKSKVTIGRSSKSDIQVIGEGISRHHLTLELISGKYYAIDHGSLNGVYINEEKLPAESKVEVLQFFPIRIGVRTTISILSDEITRDIRPQSVFEMKIKTDTDLKLEINNTRTKTKAVPKKNQIKPSSSSKPLNKQVLLILTALGLLAYFFAKPTTPQESPKVIVEEDTKINPPSANANTQQPPAFQNPYAALNVYKQREIKKYLEIYKQTGCQSDVERKACELFEAQLPLEKVVVQDKELIAYTDYRIHRSSKYLLKFDTKSETEILELWMGRLAFKAHFELQSEFVKVTIMHINAQPDQVNPLITHQSVFYKETIGKVPDQLKNIDNFIDLSITISLDEKIKPYVTHINFFN